MLLSYNMYETKVCRLQPCWALLL